MLQCIQLNEIKTLNKKVATAYRAHYPRAQPAEQPPARVVLLFAIMVIVMEIREKLPRPVDAVLGVALHVGQFVLHELRGGAWGTEFADACKPASITYYQTGAEHKPDM